MRGNQKLWVCALAFSFLAITFSEFQFLQFADVKANAPELPSMSLTIVGTNGTQIVLNEDDVAGLPSYRAYGGFKNILGILKGLGNYTGVSLNTICALAGGLTNTSVVKVIATDNYSKTFTFDEVNGEFVTYDPATGEEAPHSQPLVPIVAYHFNDANITSDGPLRIAIVGPEGLATNSSYWVKWVIRVEIIDETVPEFPSPIILLLLFLATSTAAIGFTFLKAKHKSINKLCRPNGECRQ
jgi:hypothetical protein